MGFNVRKAAGDVLILDLAGELDRHLGLQELRGTFAKLHPGKSTRLVFNFRDVTYICSEAVGEICAIADKVRKTGGRATCCALRGLPKNVFELLGVPKILSSHETEDAAVRWVNEEKSPS